MCVRMYVCVRVCVRVCLCVWCAVGRTEFGWAVLGGRGVEMGSVEGSCWAWMVELDGWIEIRRVRHAVECPADEEEVKPACTH